MKIHATPAGYRYFRCWAAGTDDTVYIHQLNAILAGADPYDVFDPDRHVHHINGIPFDNRPGNLEVRDAQEHGFEHRREQPARGPA